MLLCEESGLVSHRARLARAHQKNICRSPHTSLATVRKREAMEEHLLTAAEVAELLNVPESWVREATRERRLPHIALGRYRRYSGTQIEEWLEQQQAGSNVPGADLLSSRKRA